MNNYGMSTNSNFWC